MSTLRISDAPLLPDVDGTEKIPTGGRGDYAISVDQIKDHIFQDVGKELVGLGNVDNTSDLDKPVSTAQQEALNLKADKTYVDTNLDLKADKTSVYTRSETSLALSKKADLVNGVVPENQIPSSFNDVLEFTTSNLPLVGESGKIYVTTDTNRTWRWSGNQYVEVSNGGISDSTQKLQTPRKIANVDFDGTQNINIPHNNLVNRDATGAHSTSAIVDASGITQQDINDFGGAKWRNKASGYVIGSTIKLDNGDVVKNTIAGNTVDPNVNSTGWDNLTAQNQFLFPFYSLKKFGVKGDGVADDRQAIQDAVNYTSSIGGGTLIAPSGEYLLNSKTTEVNVNIDCLIKWKPNVSLVGLGQATKFKVGKFANSKFYAFYNYTDDLGSCSFKDFWFDGNGVENPAQASSGYDQWNIAIARADQIRLDGVNFYNAAGRQIVGLGSNSLLPTVKEVFINNCRVHKVATDIVGNDLQADHSSFYVTAGYAEIKGNILRNDAPNAVATAIECHTVNAVIDGNIIDNYNLGVITAATVRVIDDHVITNNIIKANMCWQPWVYNNHDVKRALFANNTCLQTTGAAGRNILDIANRVTSACTGIFSILNNTIIGSNVTEAQTGQHAIGIGDIATYKISGNTFRNVTGRVLSLGTLYSSNVVDIDFTNNKVENCNLTTNASYKEVIGFNSSGSIKGLKIKGNTFRSDSAVYSNRLFYGVCNVGYFEFIDNTEEGTGFTINPSWSADKFATSIIHHTTKNEAKPTVQASPTSTWKIIAPTGAALREYTRRIGSTATNFWNAIHYVNNAAPSGFDSVAGDRALNNQSAIGRPIEWICTLAGTPGTWIPSGYIGTPTTTTAALQAIGNAVNTVDKFNGKQVVNTSDSKIYYATGAVTGDAWKSFDGATTITPV